MRNPEEQPEIIDHPFTCRCLDTVAEEADAADPTNLPHVEAVVRTMRRLRAEQTRLNPRFGFADDLYYGPPKLMIVDGDYDVVREFPWDHTAYSLEEAAEVAKRLFGRVLVEQDLYVPTWPNAEDGWVDEGLSIEVWPAFRVHTQFDEKLTAAQ